jgi:hypothetical protein
MLEKLFTNLFTKQNLHFDTRIISTLLTQCPTYIEYNKKFLKKFSLLLYFHYKLGIGITDEMDLWNIPLTWAHMALYCHIYTHW